MMNEMKEQLVIPECMRTANITMLHKKQCKSNLKNWRGIFVTSVLRTILMKMLHERTYEVVASNMTDGQIGARKKKSRIRETPNLSTDANRSNNTEKNLQAFFFFFWGLC